MAKTMEVKEDFEVATNLKFKKGEIKSFSNTFVEKYGDKLKTPKKQTKKKEEE